MSDEPGGVWLACERCGRQAVATEWGYVEGPWVGGDSSRCPDCWEDGYSVIPLPVIRVAVPVPESVAVGRDNPPDTSGWKYAVVNIDHHREKTSIHLFRGRDAACCFQDGHGGYLVPRDRITWHEEQEDG